jgi:5-carboxymethyl-2-hydroxymuconate isomerase
MPHVIVEYSDQLVADFTPAAALARVNAALIASGEFEAGQIKSRALRLDVFQVGDGTVAEKAFIHAQLRLLSGRSAERKRELGAAVAQALRDSCGAAAGLHVQITVECIDMDRDIYNKLVISG